LANFYVSGTIQIDEQFDGGSKHINTLHICISSKGRNNTFLIVKNVIIYAIIM